MKIPKCKGTFSGKHIHYDLSQMVGVTAKLGEELSRTCKLCGLVNDLPKERRRRRF